MRGFVEASGAKRPSRLKAFAASGVGALPIPSGECWVGADGRLVLDHEVMPGTRPEDFGLIRVRYVDKESSDLMRAIGWVVGLLGVRGFLTDFVTTLRLPFGMPTVYWPRSCGDPRDKRWRTVWAHERVHVVQQAGPWGLLSSALLYVLLPLSVYLSGRWFLEREAYLLDIRAGRLTVDQAVELLWSSYVRPWPRAWMRAWFEMRLRTTGVGRC